MYSSWFSNSWACWSFGPDPYRSLGLDFTRMPPTLHGTPSDTGPAAGTQASPLDPGPSNRPSPQTYRQTENQLGQRVNRHKPFRLSYRNVYFDSNPIRTAKYALNSTACTEKKKSHSHVPRLFSTWVIRETNISTLSVLHPSMSPSVFPFLRLLFGGPFPIQQSF